MPIKASKSGSKSAFSKQNKKPSTNKSRRRRGNKEKIEKQKFLERKKVEAEISFKKWVLKKDRERKQEKKYTKLKEIHEKEHQMFLKEKKKVMSLDTDVMLAYSSLRNALLVSR